MQRCRYTTVTLTMSEAVSGRRMQRYYGHDAAGENTVTAATIADDGGSIALTLTNMIQNSADLSVTYAQSSTDSKKITDANGNEMVSVTTGQSVTVTNDVSAPTISSVSSTLDTVTKGIGEVIPIQILFNEVVNVQGTPQLALETGDTDAIAYYASGTGTNTLTFNYTVAAGHNVTDLDYKATTSLTLPTNSDTIRDNLSTNATLTLADPGATNSLGANEAITIEAVRPTVSSYAANAGTTTIVLTASEAVSGAPDATDFDLSVNGVSKTVSSVAISGTAITLTVADYIPNSSTVTLAYTKLYG